MSLQVLCNLEGKCNKNNNKLAVNNCTNNNSKYFQIYGVRKS